MLTPEDSMTIMQVLLLGLFFLSSSLTILIISYINDKKNKNNIKKEVSKKVSSNKNNQLERFEFEDETHYNIRRYNEIVRKQKKALENKECTSFEEEQKLIRYKEALFEQERLMEQKMRTL